MNKMSPWLMAFLCLATAGCSNVTDQQPSESQINDQVAILKQIRKVNDDGSYTYGYEAGDGSFKVETRDVLGNIKGTFGFVDATGEVKRVTYSSANGTGFKSTTVSPLQEQISVVHRMNRTATTRKPNVLYTGSTESATKGTVVQPIPRTRKLTTPPSVSSSTGSSTDHPRPSYLRPKGKHRFIINGQQRPIVLEEEEEVVVDEESPTTKSSDKILPLRKVIFTKRPLEHSLRPITEEFEDKEEEPKITTGNALRRQLPEETTKATPVIEDENDHADVYGGSLSTSRPLFTTTTSARITPRVAELRQERQKHVYVNQDPGPAKFETSSKGYEQQETKTHQTEDRNTAQQILVRSTTRAPPDARDYVRQTIEPGYLRQQPEAYLRDIGPAGVLVPAPGNNLEDDPGYRPIPLSRLFLRPELARLPPPIYTGANEANVHYLTDSPPAAQEHEEAAPRTPAQAPVPVTPAGYSPRQRAAYARLPYPEGLDPRAIDPRVVDPRVLDPRRPILRPGYQPIAGDEREYQNIASEYPYRASQLALPPEPPNPIAPPLSRRDFQILLRRLLISQYGIQALNYPKAYLEDALYDQQPYPTYQPAIQAPIGRGEVPYAAEPIGAGAPAPAPYPERVPLRRASMYSRNINPLYQARDQYDDYPDSKYQKRVYRQKFYTPEVTDDGEEVLPPHIREALLLRMLQLAIGADRPVMMSHPMPVATATTPTGARYRKGPVRSVQIIGEDAEEEKETRKQKMQ